MAQVQLYAKKQGTEEYVALDLYPEEPIKLNLSVQNIEDPLAANSVFSRTFKVPNTSVNNPYFKAVFNVNSVDFDASKKADAYINDNNLYFTSGNIRLNAVYRGEKEDSVQYEITFYGETSDFGSKIGGGFLNELDFSDYNHNKSWANVSASWNNGLFNGDIVYGLIEWGYNYNANNQPIEPTLSNGFNNSFTLTSKAYLLEQWKPQFRAKAIWDQVFEESGYTYDSVFLDSVLFKKMYIISDNIAQATLDNSNTFEAYSNRFLGTVLGATNIIEAEVEIADPGNNWTPATSRYQAPATGTYTFELDYTINIDFYDPMGSFEYISEIIVVDDVTNSGVGYDYNNITSEWANPSVSITVNLIAGQIVRFDHYSMRVSGNIYTGSTQITIDSVQIRCVLAPNILSINGIMPSNIRKIDFMRSIINRFRLVFVPSREIRNHFTITPWKDWILEGQALDWTAKLDTSKDLKITPLFYGQDRFQIYKDQEDGDFINYQYQLTYKQTVGQLNLDSTNELIKGTKVYQDSFAPTPIAPIGFKDGDVPGSRFVIPHIAKDVGSTDDTAGTTVITGKREPIQPKLRLVFYNGLIVAPLTWYARKQNGGHPGAYETLTTYPLMSSYSEWPVSSSTFDLNWENEAPFWDATDNYLGNGQTAFSCFNTYWKTWYDVTFDPYSRIVEANLILDYSDILDLKFNDYVFIKDSWYFVNNITDYIAGQSTNCRVQLIKVGNIGITLPIVAEVEYTPINLCTASTACFAFCCNPNVGGNPSSGTYYMDAVTLATTTRLYTDQFGSIVASNGFYSDGTTTIQVVGGNAIAIIDTSACDCTVTSYAFTVKFASTLCGQAGVCCNGITQTVYGANPVFENNSYLYYNAGLTLPVGQGHYKETAGTDALKVQGLLGQVIEIGTCTACPPCDTYYPHTICYATTEASQYYSCCCEDIQTVWTNNSLFTGSTEIYLDNSGATPAPLGYYNESGDIGRVNVTAGVISSFANCVNSDITCPVLDVDIEVSLTAGVPGYVSTATLYKSNDQVSWVAVGSVSIGAGDPAFTTVVNTFTVEELVYTKCTFATNTLGGILTSEVVVNLTQIQEHANATPISYTEVLAGTVSSTNTYRYSGVIEGGDVGTVDKVYVGGNYTTYQDAGWPLGGTISDLLLLDTTATIDTNFDTSTGFANAFNPQFVFDLQEAGGILTCGNFGRYKNILCTEGVTLLNLDGALNAGFNIQRGCFGTGTPVGGSGANTYLSVYANTADTKNGYAYVGGYFNTWEQNAVGDYITPPDPHYTYIAKVNIATGLVDDTFAVLLKGQTGTDIGYLPTINRIKIYNDKIYVAGSFQIVQGGNTWNSMVRLNMDGTIDTSWSNKGVDYTYAFGQTPPDVTDFEFYGSYVYACGNFSTWQTSTGTFVSNKFIRLNVNDGSPDITFNTNGGFDFNCITLAVDSTGIYCGGSFLNYGGIDIPNRLVKINHDATVNATFVSPGVTAVVSDLKLSLDNTELYVGGNFLTYNGVTSKGLVKVDPITAVRDSTFAVGEGFEINTDVNVILLGYGAATPTTFPLGLCVGENPCDAYCCIGSELVYYGNASSLYASTILYANAGGTIPVNAGWYSDGATIVQVDGGGNIIAYGDPESCVCGPGLYEFNVLYDATVPCNACCGALSVTVYSTSVFWSAATILYDDPAGTTTSADGHYNYQGLLNNLSNADGVVTSQTDCNDSCFPCPSQDCVALTIMNTDFIEIFYSYTSCSQVYFSGTLQPGEQYVTQCLELQNFFITGSYGIINQVIC